MYAVSHHPGRPQPRHLDHPKPGPPRCVPCGLCWDNREEQSQHVKSDFHRYNLKRRVAGLEPALESDFNLKMSILASTGPELTQVIGGPKMPRRKRLLKKHKGDRMQNANVLLETGKDMPESTRQGRDESEGGNSSEDQDDVGEDEASECDPYEDTQCLFDGNTYGSFDDNLEAMRAQYSLMVPDEQYCLDLREFLRYLGAKVYEGHLCLWCNRQFRSTLAVQNHMLDKGHQRIGCHLDEQIEEYALFFDYSTSYLELNLPEEIKRKLVAIANGEELLELTDVEDEAEQTEVERPRWKRRNRPRWKRPRWKRRNRPRQKRPSSA
ncbi:C2H2 type zinc-finger protein [Gregarina niphandrodes]|uniref:C2H2 type zinc-finger protein n=1 Tax=Gregarina niphandrodes TaxID=110365 RepID=A0A023BBR3_GRENI|nr:C2H2 type zinc-finger protein [Gregarina niphandrodes]EZG80325.1 C2H2 type zinc-finger protein [Gregarina niphandrodes]|eukprot:XP_011134299.1 C2H2 type zinc-finger protein [Gregarina niphandrodes]